MADEQEERREIEAYLEQHHLQSFIGDAVNDIVKDRPNDPLLTLGDALRACSDASRQIQNVRGRQVLNGEAMPALAVEIRTGQGLFFAAVSSGPFDGIDDYYDGRGVLKAVDSTDQMLADILLGKDPTRQTNLDKVLNQENLPANVVSAASIACCKAGARQASVSVFDHVGTLCNNSEGGIPATAFSIINGGQSAASSLWIQDIFIVPIGGTLSERLRAASTVHRNIEAVARDAGQGILQRGPRGGFCNGAGTFEHLVDCLLASLDTAGRLDSFQLVVDVHASRLVSSSVRGEGQVEDGKRPTEYDLATFSSNTAVEMTTAQALLDIYIEWLEKYPIIAFVEPFAAADIVTSKELLIRGHQILQTKAARAGGEVAHSLIVPSSGDAQMENPGSMESAEGLGGDESCVLRIIADESVSKLPQLTAMNDQRGANAVMINTSKFSTVSDMIALTTRASELGWAIVVAAANEQELEGEFLADFGVGVRAEQLLLGGLRSAGTVAACTRLMRIEDEGVPHVRDGKE